MNPAGPPPSYTSSQPVLPAGNRFPSSTTSAFPNIESIGPAPFKDLGGEPVWVASALIGNGKSVQPCKVAPHLQTCTRVGYGGTEMEHQGRYDVLPLTSEMEWVHTREGVVPKGRRAVEGGFEESGEHLFHALITIKENGLKVPGKTGEHLRAAHCAYGGGEYIVQEYEILLWK